MKLKVLMMASAAMFMLLALQGEAYAQQQQDAPDIYEQAEMEADRLQRILDLEDWQVFYVDSTLSMIFLR